MSGGLPDLNGEVERRVLNFDFPIAKYLLKWFATNDSTAIAEVNILILKQGSLTATNFVQRLWSKTLRCAFIYDEKIVKFLLWKACTIQSVGHFVNGGPTTGTPHKTSLAIDPTRLLFSKETNQEATSRRRPTTRTEKDCTRTAETDNHETVVWWTTSVRLRHFLHDATQYHFRQTQAHLTPRLRRLALSMPQ